MVTALKPFEYGRVLGLFEPLAYNLAVQAIVGGRAPGSVYADFTDRPSVGLIWDGKAILFLSGEPEAGVESGFGEVLSESVLPEVADRGLLPWLRVVCPPAWEGRLAEALGAESIDRRIRYHYSLRELRVDRRKLLPADCRPIAVDPDLFAGAGPLGLDRLTAEILGTWGSLETFFEWGFGQALVAENRLVSWCLSEYNAPDECELGVETVRDRRRVGLATIATAACVDYALERGVSPKWHCWPENAGSVGVARAVGFIEDLTYQVYLPKWAEFDSRLAARGF
ncbi:MAG TPA: GNAT family N-acetyltransferase [Bacillota bacterium]|jgi:hypothetical protein